ncbi:dNTP triphosphohydrolase [Candidatus Peribacteria bacterium]|jgi:dGTPase|nr:dNTP triphosphohydrolase [Candidatus Peribacteria bacterium]MBT4021428.1 dNTP triphosphohydrolase [Candidatus Peribacteria bacterium]MBT4240444.1 dNTP triphosphohydrolase [Candidatus Peribacteria bacterium]MBT4474526.1 dNTP triphosphohydrolase [Candidatus Peribacteria bacterium]
MKNLKALISGMNSLLSSYAIPHGTGLGRNHEEKEDETRTPFQRDRDRIIHTQAFRRLKHKTQVFVGNRGLSDHYRTRLTHTMEVAQISRDMARTLSLNEDLAECIALAHDLGHTPFGHAGEEAINEEMQRFGKEFEHNNQSLRTVTILEERSNKYNGLNLNQEVLEGLMKHRTSFDSPSDTEIPRSPSLEAQIVNLADEIAYTSHDIDDGIRSGILNSDELVKLSLFARAKELSDASGTEVKSSVIHILVIDAYSETEKRLKEANISSLEDVYAAKNDLIAFSASTTQELKGLREYLFSNFYNSPEVLVNSNKGKEIIQVLFSDYEKNPPEKVLELQERTNGSLDESIKDYIAGMTDNFAMESVSKASNT